MGPDDAPGEAVTDLYPTEAYLARSNGRLACPHPNHRFAQVRKSPARIILPECAGRGPWLAARRDGIGGSEVGALIGVNEYETAFSIYDKKTRTDPDVELTGAAIEWGHRLEDVVAMKTAEEIGMVSRFGGGLWADKERPFLRVTPDRFATKPRSWYAEALIECKTAGDDEHWTSGNITATGQGSGSAPLSYQCQVQWQMGIIGMRKAFLGCFVVGRERSFYTVEVDFNPEWFAEMTAAAERFWHDNLLGGEIPMHDLRHPKTEEMLKKISPSVVRPSVDLPEESIDLLRDYKIAKERLKTAETEMDAIKNFFRMWTADAGAGYLGEQKVVSYPEVSTSSFDTKAFREDHPELVEKYTRSSKHRRLTISPPKGL